MVKKEILVTGTTGFIGRVIKEYLIAHGYSVLGTTNRGQTTADVIQIDIRKPDELKKLPNRDFPIIIHTVGIIDSDVDKNLMFDVNVNGTQNLLNWAKLHGCKHFIQLSSVSVYGYKLLGENRSESKTHRCRYIGINYSKSKAEAERRIEKSGVPYTLLRIPPVLGENDNYITPTIVPRLLNGTLYFGGRRDKQFSMFYVKNIGSVLLKTIEAGPSNDAFNCVDYTVDWRDYCAEYAKILKTPMPLQIKSMMLGLFHWNDKHYLLMIGYSGMGASYPSDKLKSRINWQPEFPWQAGVLEAINSFMNSYPEYRQKWNLIRNAEGVEV